MANFNESLATAERPRDYAGLLWIFAAGIIGFGMFCATSAVALSDSSVQGPIAVAPGDIVNRAFSDINTAAALTAQAFVQYIPTDTATPTASPTPTVTFTSSPTPTNTHVFIPPTSTRQQPRPTAIPPRPTNTPIPVKPNTPTSQPPPPTNPPAETPTEAPCFCTDTPEPPPPPPTP
jgi:hypothetical protein